MKESVILERCNRCCSRDSKMDNGYVKCNNCGQKELLADWQLVGWRNIEKNPPFFSGAIHVYGKEIGRTMASWDSDAQTCDNPKATHWLRVPDPRKQIGME